MRLAIAWLLAAAPGCDDDEVLPPPPLGVESFNPAGAVAPSGSIEPATGSTGPSSTSTAGQGSVSASATDASASATDASATDMTLGTGIMECQSACDCPPLTRCTAGGCEPSSQQVWCCGEPTCPPGEPCEGPRGVAGICP